MINRALRQIEKIARHTTRVLNDSYSVHMHITGIIYSIQRSPQVSNEIIFKMAESSRVVQFKKSIKDIMTPDPCISEELKLIFSYVDEMNRSFLDRDLATRSIGKFQYRAWEASRDFCNSMVGYGVRKRLQNGEGFHVYSEW